MEITSNLTTLQADHVISLLNEGRYEEAVKLAGSRLTANGEQLLHLLATYAPKPEHEALFLQTVRELCKNMDINGVDYTGVTALYRAAKAKNNIMVNLLIELQADPILRLVANGQRAVDMYYEHEPLATYTTMFEERILNNPYANFEYRLAEYYRRSFYAIQHPNENFYDGYQMDKTIPNDWQSVKQQLEKADLAYRYYLTHDEPESRKHCILCNAETEWYCFNCNIVRVCRKCTLNPNPIIRLRGHLHGSVCENEFFEPWAERHPEGNGNNTQ